MIAGVRSWRIDRADCVDDTASKLQTTRVLAIPMRYGEMASSVSPQAREPETAACESAADGYGGAREFLRYSGPR